MEKPVLKKIKLPDCSSLQVILVGRNEESVLELEMDRDSEAKPQITIKVFDASGELKASHTIFDLDV